MLYLTLEDTHTIGSPKQNGTHSNVQDHFAVMFEDDGESGYFYALDTRQAQSVVDALHLYNVESFSDTLQADNQLQICWSQDGNLAVLLLNGQVQAAFDFAKLIGYNHSHFPEPELGSMWSRGKLDDTFVEGLKA
ncbi:DUF2251 domain-containing protein [Pasteurellaceae bacterium TAE3-ERU1]|nr:DUF2251 domain-containing protein [Pasteurellaceae bacterium TAE3-ERU1]